VKGQELIMDNKDQNYGFVDDFLEEAIKNSSIYETDEDIDYEYLASKYNAHATVSIRSSYIISV
jgi:hypothetical protein